MKLFICGDIYKKSEKKLWISKEMHQVIKSSDYSFCNLEGPFIKSYFKPIIKAGPLLAQNKTLLNDLSFYGFTHAAVANNHIFDYGNLGLKHTLNQLKKNKINFFGAGETYFEAYKIKILKKKNIKIGLFSVCENFDGCLTKIKKEDNPGYSWLFSSHLDEQIKKYQKKLNFIILFAHAGIEDLSFPIPEIRSRFKYLSKIGVDIIVGSHPHVPQGIEKISNKVIFYSLGNFYFENLDSDVYKESFSVLINFSSKKFNYNLVYHKTKNNKVNLCAKSDVNFNIVNLNKILKINFLKINKKTAVILYDTYYKYFFKVYLDSFFGIKIFIKRIIKNMLYLNYFKSKTLILHKHFEQVESHKFTIQRGKPF
jgi:poly-gamma-glutamate synthesis protein (capsule biosynthesis protein)